MNSVAAPLALNLSQIDDNVALGLAAADQHISVRGRINRVWPVANRPCHKAGFTCVADPRSARPSHRYVAGFGKLEKALKSWLPADIKAAPGE
jgi:hypothetical protein